MSRWEERTRRKQEKAALAAQAREERLRRGLEARLARQRGQRQLFDRARAAALSEEDAA